MIQNKILLVYVEPTPYIVGLIHALVDIWPGEIDVVFLCENLSQQWNVAVNKEWRILPKNKFKQFYLLSRLILKNNYQLVHLAGWGNLLFVWAIFFSYSNGIPVSLESDTPLPAQQSFLKKIIKYFIYPRLFKRVIIFLPGGQRQAKYFNFYGVNNEQIVPAQMTVDVAQIKKYIGNLSDHDRFDMRQRLGIKNDSITFLYVGRLVEQKGVSDLIAAFENLKDKKVTLLIAGDGNMRSRIEEIAKNSANIIYAGRLSDHELLNAYFSADIVVLPSHCEPWGLVVNEAMAVGKPVVVSDKVGCIDDLVIPYETGLIVKSKCATSLKEALEYMCDNDNHLSMGKNAAQLIKSWTLENEARTMCYAWEQFTTRPRNDG